MKAIVIILSLGAFFGCTPETQCEIGDVVLLEYKMFIRDSVRINENNHSNHCDQEQKAMPHKVVLGNREIYPTWEKDILSKKENEPSVVFVPVKDVYHPDAVLDQGNIRLFDTIKIEYTILEIQKN